MEVVLPSKEVLAAWKLEKAQLQHLPAGHINLTFRVEHRRGRFLLQRLNPIFSPEVHHDIEAITARIEAKGITTPRLVRTRAKDLWHQDPEGQVWRVFTFVEGQSLLTTDSEARCREAGKLLGEFHKALWDFEYTFRHGRFGVHDTAKHLAALTKALADHKEHPVLERVEPVADEILGAAARQPPDAVLPERIVHGDPKISNVMFDEGGRALCLVDLDTLARMPIAVELGDAFRSWCNPAGEDQEAEFKIEFFRAGVQGYAGAVGELPLPAERATIAQKVEIIALELAARFCADALNESYFNWDRTRYPSAAEHNLVRARAQLHLSRSIGAQRGELERIVAEAWK